MASSSAGPGSQELLVKDRLAEPAEQGIRSLPSGQPTAQLGRDLRPQFLQALLQLPARQRPVESRSRCLAVQPHRAPQQGAQVQLPHDPVLVVTLSPGYRAVVQAAEGADHRRGEIAYVCARIAPELGNQPFE